MVHFVVAHIGIRRKSFVASGVVNQGVVFKTAHKRYS